MNTGASRLAPLHNLTDYKVADHNLDVRGWEVVGADGKRLGVVDDLIVDREVMKVRYLDIDVDKHLLLPDTDLRHILIPIGAAHLDDDSDQVFVSNLNEQSLGRYPFYHGGPVEADYEHRVMHAITHPGETYASTGNTAPTEDFYRQEHFNEDRFYQNRMQAGGLGTSPVHEDIATIERLRQMLEQGTITQEEFSALKRKAIGL
ncbi:MAG: PRC-barrel domain-containing protein [Rufibacter sp.]